MNDRGLWRGIFLLHGVCSSILQNKVSWVSLLFKWFCFASYSHFATKVFTLNRFFGKLKRIHKKEEAICLIRIKNF